MRDHDCMPITVSCNVNTATCVFNHIRPVCLNVGDSMVIRVHMVCAMVRVALWEGTSEVRLTWNVFFFHSEGHLHAADRKLSSQLYVQAFSCSWMWCLSSFAKSTVSGFCLEEPEECTLINYYNASCWMSSWNLLNFNLTWNLFRFSNLT